MSKLSNLEFFEMAAASGEAPSRNLVLSILLQSPKRLALSW
jgi:hypothetical protein